MEYCKPFLPYEAQYRLLYERGMRGNRAEIISCLQKVGYYRLSGYWHIFKNLDNSFRNDTQFEKVWDYYVLDRQLRLLVFDAIERVEIFCRAKLAYCLAEKAGPFGYLQKEKLPRLKPYEYQQLLARIKLCVDHSRDPFMVHFKQTYDNYIPYWILVNVLEFGLIVTLYKGASVEIRKAIAGELGVSSYVLDSWLKTLNVIRNIVAHHGRLWNRDLGVKPIIPKAECWHDPVEIAPKKVFAVLTILNYLLNEVAPKTQWKERLMTLLTRYDEVDIRRMGFPDGWERSPLWNERWPVQ